MLNQKCHSIQQPFSTSNTKEAISIIKIINGILIHSHFPLQKKNTRAEKIHCHVWRYDRTISSDYHADFVIISRFVKNTRVGTDFDVKH